MYIPETGKEGLCIDSDNLFQEMLHKVPEQ